MLTGFFFFFGSVSRSLKALESLQEYVKTRNFEFAQAFARRVCPNLPEQAVDNVCREVYHSLSSGPQRRIQDATELQLVYRHDCRFV